jgi:uncharacterized protein YjbI with pentapeptide repeats
MADGLDPLDIEALKTSVNDSAVRVSTIWISFLTFGLYLVITAGAVTHRQLMLEEPVKLPVLNVDLPFVGFFLLAPILFVAFHGYVLLQVLLLARTAGAYNEAIERGVVIASDRDRVRQRLANTLFAQMFAGSSREREGLIGKLLRLMAWATLAIAPLLVLLTFEVRFLPYHSSFVTWSHRILIALDLTGVLLLWRGVLDSQRDIVWRGLFEQRAASFAAFTLVLFSGFAISFPGEKHTNWMRMGNQRQSECGHPFFIEIFSDRLSLPRETLIDTEKLAKIETATKATSRKPSEGERTRNFDRRDLSCGVFLGADLRRVDFRDAILRGAELMHAQLQGANLDHAHLQGARLTFAQLQGADLESAELQRADLQLAQLPGAHLVNAVLREAWLNSADLQGAELDAAQLQGANLRRAELQGARLGDAYLQRADLFFAQLQGADLKFADLRGADLSFAQLQGADLEFANLQGAKLFVAQLQGARFDNSSLTFAEISRAHLWRATDAPCDDANVTEPIFEKRVVEIEIRNLKTVTVPPGAYREDSEIVMHPVEIEKFIEQTIRNVPEPINKALQAELRARLGTADASDDIVTEAWRDCAGKALPLDEYERKRHDYLEQLGTQADESSD